MGLDLTPRWDNFAVYLPSIQYGFATAVDADKKRDKNRAFPANIKMTDLDFLNAKSKLWHYGYALYSAGQFTSDAVKPCAVSNRDRSNTVIVGDSGGFQIGSGTMRGMEGFKKLKTGAEVCDAWRDSKDVMRWIVNWLDTHSDYAMTIDIPLWAKLEARKASPFHKCTEQELIDLSVENLEFIKHNTRGTTKWLNVLQGIDAASSKNWFDAVKKYKLSGWALGSKNGFGGGLETILRFTLMARDEGGFEAGQDWLHILGISTPIWAVVLSAVQRGLRTHVNPALRVSYDSASPFQIAGQLQQVARYPRYTKDLRDWTIKAQTVPVNPQYANDKTHFPFSSPVGELMTLAHLNVRGGDFQSKTFDTTSYALLANHNLYVYIRCLLEANELAFLRNSERHDFVPATLIEACDFVEDLMGEQNWEKRLKKESGLLQRREFVNIG